jgi:BirA family biotin operon repressor/biotin-[acetyl-CoA-carboxylase] ligase
LAEAAWEGGEPVGVVLGIGVNALSGSAPPDSEVDSPAVSVEDALGKPVDRIRLLARILHHLHRWYQDLDSPGLIAAWQSHLSYRDETVVVQDGERVLRGILRGLGPTGCLILEVPERGRVEVLSGQLGLRPIDSPEESATLEGGEEPDVRQPS